MSIIQINEPMRNLSPQQKNEAEQLFSRALQSAKANDYVTATKYYKRAAEYGHPGAQNNLGNQYKNGRGVNKDPQEAVRLFTLSAKQGSVFGMRNLASCYMDGIGTNVDFNLAVDWLETAAEQKDNLACAMLAKAYDNWNHRDEEKKIFWHKKAAEYGNPDSMFVLGEYYGKKGDNQDLSLASTYYDNAAKNGSPEMKLKVAKAFDLPSYGNETAINLEKAKYWYNELLTCENDNIKLDAAKGLDEMSDWGGTVRRPALDINKAYMTYRMLAMKGNKSACSLAAYCSEVGKGTNPNIDIAIMFYEMAKEVDKVNWCKKKKAGDLSDYTYESNVDNSMPLNPGNEHSHGKEFYRNNVDCKISAYNGQIYYLKSSYSSESYLCSSDMDGNNIKIISEIKDDFNYSNIHVNTTGIYLYYTQDYDRLMVQHIDFNGKLLAECREEYEGGYEDGHSVSNIYIYDNNIYYVYEYHIDDESKCQIRCMHVDSETVEILYEKATSIEKLYATEERLIFFARYENDDCEEGWDAGWMILDMIWNNVECLSNPYCSPENIVDNPSVYDTEEPGEYEKIRFNRNIVFFDLNRNIFWTERTVMEGVDSAHLKPVKYWEPKSLFGNRDEIVPDMPVWKMCNESGHIGREYFDGIYHYYSESYHQFKSSNKYGEEFDWATGNGGHGVCDQFQIIGDYMFLNIAAYDEEQYPLTVGVGTPIRKSWFDNSLSNEVINFFRKDEGMLSNEVREETAGVRDIQFDKSVGEEVNKEPTSISAEDLFGGLKEEPKEEFTVPKDLFLGFESENTFAITMKLSVFRSNADKFVGARETLINFRKSLPEKWDYNAFVGILMSVKGPKHGDSACMNMAIGQGDNFKSTETRLEAMGLMEVFNKYKGKKYDQSVTVSQVEDEIVIIAPEYKGIREFFDKVVLAEMEKGNYNTANNDSEGSESKTNRSDGECADHDLVVEKTIGDTDIKYNICTFGARFHIGFGISVTIRINGKKYTAKTHNTAKGRIDGMKKLYSENGIVLGDKLKATYHSGIQEIHLEKIN